MKTLGLVGGVGPGSTIDYYRQIIALYRERTKDGGTPALIINSIDLKRVLEWAANDNAKLADYLEAEVRRLASAGAQFAAIASNTPHIVFSEVARRSSILMVSIVEAARDAAKRAGFKRVGLIGHRLVMRGRFYPETFAQESIEIILPQPAELEYIHEKYTGELLKNQFLPETRERMLAIAQRMKEDNGIQALILGGTELPLLLREAPIPGVPYLDTTEIHVKTLVDHMFADEAQSVTV